MKKKYFLCLLPFLFIPIAFLQAQETTLKEITVYGIPTEKYAAGAKIYELDSVSLQQNATGSLTDILTSRTALYMKNYGNGMTSTIAFRGTSPNHTAVLWNGFNINQPTLGQSDFSIIPVIAFGQLNIQYGSAGSLYGSDAIGGSIHLSSQPAWKKGYEGQIRLEAGSFHTFNTQATARYSNEKVESKTSLYFSSSENNFPYRNTSKSGTPIERQLHAGILQKGFTQDLYFKLASNRYVALKSWYNSSVREIQPIIGLKENDESQQDQNLRLAGEYHQQTKIGYTNARVAFIKDILLFKKPSSLIDSRANTNKVIARLEHEIKINNRMAVRAGAEGMLIEANVNGYDRNITENRGDVFLLFSYQVHPRWLTTLNIRQAFIQGYQPPLSPSFGSEYMFYKHQAHKLVLKTNFSRSYRIPTLNERYWNPGGNIHLLPEDAIGGEAGIAYTIQKKSVQGNIEITHYQNRINQLIQWQPDLENASAFWSPENLQLVYSRGIEIASSLQAKTSYLILETGLQYAFTKSTQEKVNNSHDIGLKGNQLMYVPYHNGILYGNTVFNNWQVGANFSYTSSRYTNNSNSNYIPGYTLINFKVGRKFILHQHTLQVSAKVNNLINTDYQTIEARAMPGRNYAITINYHFTKTP